MKRIISLFITIILIFASIASLNVSASYDLSKYKSALDFLKMLDIVGSESMDAEQMVSRGNFAGMIVKAFSAEPDTYQNIFTDVPSSSPDAGYIQTAYNLGIINGFGAGNFSPDEPVTYAAVIKMAVAGLGYSRIASALGGFPTGYLVVANDIGLTSGVGGSWNEPMNFSNICVLLYNLLNSDICDITGVVSGDVTQARQYGVSPLVRNFGLSRIEGVVKTSGYASMLTDVNIKKSQLTIGTKTFSLNVPNPQKYIGRDVIAWYGDDEIVSLIYVKPQNNVVVIPVDEVDNFNNFELTTYNPESEDEAKYLVDKGYTFILNGRGKEPFASDYFFNEGNIEIIDNNADNIYDVVYARKMEYIVAATIDNINGNIYDTNYGGKVLTLKNGNGYFYSLEILDKNGNAVSGTIDDLSPDSVIMYSISEDGKFIEATACKQAVQKSVEEVSDNEVMAGGEVYKINSYFKNYDQITPGLSATFLIAPDGTLTSFQLPRTDSMSYGYFVDFYKNINGISSDVQIEILASNGSKFHTVLADKVTLNGERYSASDSVIEGTFMSGSVPEYQVIRYKLDENGRVSVIDTSERFEDLYPDYSLNDKYKPVEYSDNSLLQYFSQKKSFWHAESKVFSPHVIMGDNTIVFSVPQELAINNNKRYDGEYFTVLNTSMMDSYGTHTIDAYDLNNQLEPGVIVLYNPDAGDTMTVRKHTALGMIDKVSTGINDDGEMVHLISVWVNGRYYDYTIDYEVYNNILNSNALTDEEKKHRSDVIMKGDIVRVAVDGYGKVKALSVDGRYNPVKKTAEATSSAPHDGQIDDSVYSGKVYSHSANHLSLVVENSFYNSGYSDEIIDKIAPFGLRNDVTICVYDTKTSVVKTAKLSMLKDALAVGEENASNIFLKCYSHTVQQIFLYE